MVKLWGGFTEDLRTYPGGMFSQNEGRRGRRLYMKCPKPFDIQRMCISRYLMNIRNFNVYSAKKLDLEFEKKVAKRLQEPVNKWSQLRHIQRRWKINNEDTFRPRDLKTRCILSYTENEAAELLPKSVDEIITIKLQKAYLEHGKYDFDRVRYKTFSGDYLRPEKLSQDIRRKFNLERKSWLKRYLKDMMSDQVYEILADSRMTSLAGESFPFQMPYITYYECLRYALKEHRWEDALLSLLGLITQAASMFTHEILQLASIWNFAFLAIINCFKDDIGKIVFFARAVQMNFPRLFPGYLGSHLAIWLLQKGYFKEAHRMLNDEFFAEPESFPQGRYSAKTIVSFFEYENPRRDQAVFVCELIKATHAYYSWKKDQIDTQNIDDPLYQRDDDELRRKGESALNIYEHLYASQTHSGTDVMMFLEQFVELLVEYRSVYRARDVLLEMWNKNEGNMYFEKFLLDFLDKHPGIYTEMPEYLQKMKENIKSKYKCAVESELTYLGRRKINKLRKRRKKEDIAPAFEKISNPGFSTLS